MWEHNPTQLPSVMLPIPDFLFPYFILLALGLLYFLIEAARKVLMKPPLWIVIGLWFK